MNKKLVILFIINLIIIFEFLPILGVPVSVFEVFEVGITLITPDRILINGSLKRNTYNY